MELDHKVRDRKREGAWEGARHKTAFSHLRAKIPWVREKARAEEWAKDQVGVADRDLAGVPAEVQAAVAGIEGKRSTSLVKKGKPEQPGYSAYLVYPTLSRETDFGLNMKIGKNTKQFCSRAMAWLQDTIFITNSVDV